MNKSWTYNLLLNGNKILRMAILNQLNLEVSSKRRKDKKKSVYS